MNITEKIAVTFPGSPRDGVSTQKHQPDLTSPAEQLDQELLGRIDAYCHVKEILNWKWPAPPGRERA